MVLYDGDGIPNKAMGESAEIVAQQWCWVHNVVSLVSYIWWPTLCLIDSRLCPFDLHPPTPSLLVNESWTLLSDLSLWGEGRTREIMGRRLSLLVKIVGIHSTLNRTTSTQITVTCQSIVVRSRRRRRRPSLLVKSIRRRTMRIRSFTSELVTR